MGAELARLDARNPLFGALARKSRTGARPSSGRRPPAEPRPQALFRVRHQRELRHQEEARRPRPARRGSSVLRRPRTRDSSRAVRAGVRPSPRRRRARRRRARAGPCRCVRSRRRPRRPTHRRLAAAVRSSADGLGVIVQVEAVQYAMDHGTEQECRRRDEDESRHRARRGRRKACRGSVTGMWTGPMPPSSIAVSRKASSDVRCSKCM